MIANPATSTKRGGGRVPDPGSAHGATGSGTSSRMKPREEEPGPCAWALRRGYTNSARRSCTFSMPASSRPGLMTS